MSGKPTRPAMPVALSASALAVLAPLLIGSAIALSTGTDGAETPDRATSVAGSLRSVQTRPVDLAALPESAFGDQD